MGNCGASIVQFSKKLRFSQCPSMIEFLSHLPNCYRLLLATQVFKRIEGLKVFFFSLHDLAFPQKCFLRLGFFPFCPFISQRNGQIYLLAKRNIQMMMHQSREFFPMQWCKLTTSHKRQSYSKQKYLKATFYPFFAYLKGGRKGGPFRGHKRAVYLVFSISCISQRKKNKKGRDELSISLKIKQSFSFSSFSTRVSRRHFPGRERRKRIIFTNPGSASKNSR